MKTRLIPLLALPLLVAPAGAMAQEEPYEEYEAVEAEVFISSGEIIVDATEHKNHFLPNPSPMSFETEQDFVMYIASITDAPILADPEGNPSVMVTQTIYGTPYMLSPDGEEVRIVENPLAAMIGGFGEYVMIADQLRCLTDTCAVREGLKEVQQPSGKAAHPETTFQDAQRCVDGQCIYAKSGIYDGWYKSAWSETCGETSQQEVCTTFLGLKLWCSTKDVPPDILKVRSDITWEWAESGGECESRFYYGQKKRSPKVKKGTWWWFFWGSHLKPSFNYVEGTHESVAPNVLLNTAVSIPNPVCL